MTRNLIYVGLAVLLIAGAAFLTGCGPKETPQEETPTVQTETPETNTGAVTGETETVAAKQYVCPMHCTDDKFDSPEAQCPVCGMKCTEEYVEGGTTHTDMDMDGMEGEMPHTETE